MGILRSIRYYIGIWFHRRSRPIAHESSLLGSLPPELILHIAQFLPLESTLSFCLCCWPIYSLLKLQYVKIIKDDQQLDRYKFLTLLERDLPDHILCYYCRRLHAIKKAHQYFYSSYRFYQEGDIWPCCYVDSENMSNLFIHPAFSFTVFHMMMKRYRQGFDYSKLSKLLSHQSENYVDYSYSTVEKHSSSSKIVAGSLFIRDQRRFMIPPTQPITMSENVLLTICRHITFSSCGRKDRDIMRIARWRESRHYQNGNRPIKCQYCFTEFRIDFKEFGNGSTAIYVTNWKDLGHSLSPPDPKWCSHISEDRLCKRVKFDLGSICFAFEGKEHIEFEFDSL